MEIAMKLTRKQRLELEQKKTAALLKKVGYKGGSNYRPPLPNYKVEQVTAPCSNNVVYRPHSKKVNEYTGTEIIGIAVMHKSNAVPIRSKDSAVEVARMRRG